MTTTLAFLSGGVPGIGEIVIIALILALLFGARKLPGLARALGSSLAEFKRGRREGERIDAESEPRETRGKPRTCPARRGMNANEREAEKETPHGKA